MATAPPPSVESGKASLWAAASLMIAILFVAAVAAWLFRQQQAGRPEPTTLPTAAAVEQFTPPRCEKGTAFTSLADALNAPDRVCLLSVRNESLNPLINNIDQFSNLKILDIEAQLLALPPQITRLSSLVLLDLDHNQINTLPRDLPNLNNLRYLRVRGNRISEKEIQELQQAMPATIIVF